MRRFRRRFDLLRFSALLRRDRWVGCQRPRTSGAAKLGAATDSTTGGCDPATGRCTKAYIVPALGAPFVIDGRDVRNDVTVGIALAPRDGVTLDRLPASADAAL